MRKRTRREMKLLSKPWITKGIKISIAHKNKLFKKAIQDKSRVFTNHFKIYRNTLTRVIERSKKNYYKREIIKCKGNSRKIWKTINSITFSKNKQATHINKILDKDNTEKNRTTGNMRTFERQLCKYGL